MDECDNIFMDKQDHIYNPDNWSKLSITHKVAHYILIETYNYFLTKKLMMACKRQSWFFKQITLTDNKTYINGQLQHLN